MMQIEHNNNIEMNEQKEKQEAPFIYRAIEQFLEAKSDPNGGKGNKQLSNKTLQELKSVGGIIVDTWKYKRVNEVTAEMITTYLNKTKTAKGKYFTNQTKLNRLTKIKQFFFRSACPDTRQNGGRKLKSGKF